MRIAVTGRHGQVVTALVERGKSAGCTILPIGRPEIDLANPGSVLHALRLLAPDAVVSAAAFTAVDKAEREVVQATAVNVQGAHAVAEAARDLGIPVLHLSTDYVFDGVKREPYTEADATNPLSVYGRTKLAGEEMVRGATDDHVILRTAWVYSPFGQNFVKTMLRLAADRPVLRVVDDQRGSPTAALDIADAVLTMTRRLAEHPQDADLRGCFNVAGFGEASWAGFAREIFAISAHMGGPTAEVEPIATKDYPTDAHRPANSRLATDKIARTFGIMLPAWQQSTAETIRRLLNS